MTLALVFAAALVETAKPAAAFVDSVGVVTHFPYYDTPYGKRFPEVVQRLHALGVRHVRDAVVMGQDVVCARERGIAASGIRFTYITQPTLKPEDLSTWAACAGPAIEGFEAPNEYDLSHPGGDTGWVQTLRTFQKTLYTAVKTTPALRHLTVTGPSLTTGDAFRAVGDLSAYMDYGNMHDYFGGHEPDTGGWGDGGYGSIAYNMAAARAVSGTKPIAATETGYGTQNATGDVAEDIQAAYVPRLFLDHFAAGVVRTDEYEFLDEGPDPYSHYGLLRGDLTPKPAYIALQSLLGTLADVPGSARADRLPYTLDAGGDVRHVLFEKHDGSFFVALWVQRPTVEPHTRLRFPLPAREVRVRVGAGATLRSFVYGADDRLRPGVAVQHEAVVELSDRAALIEIRPAAKHPR